MVKVSWNSLGTWSSSYHKNWTILPLQSPWGTKICVFEVTEQLSHLVLQKARDRQPRHVQIWIWSTSVILPGLNFSPHLYHFQLKNHLHMLHIAVEKVKDIWTLQKHQQIIAGSQQFALDASSGPAQRRSIQPQAHFYCKASGNGWSPERLKPHWKIGSQLNPERSWNPGNFLWRKRLGMACGVGGVVSTRVPKNNPGRQDKTSHAPWTKKQSARCFWQSRPNSLDFPSQSFDAFTILAMSPKLIRRLNSFCCAGTALNCPHSWRKLEDTQQPDAANYCIPVGGVNQRTRKRRFAWGSPQKHIQYHL